MKLMGCILALILLAGMLANAQNVSSSVKGSIIDQSDATVAGAVCSLVNQASGVVMTATSWTDGSFTFPSVQPGEYTLKIRADGFKVLSMKDITVDANQVRTLGKLKLTVGAIAEVLTVEANATPIQLATAEKSGTVSGAQLENVAIRGRDPYGILATIPGIVDSGVSRETTSNKGLEGTYINGGRARSINYTIDGVYGHNSSNGSIVTQPNMEAIAQVKVLTSNYQAEYGRHSSGMVSVITKSGSRDFHGSAFETYRHESLNANSFFNNRSGTAKNRYRYKIPGYSIGGPVFIPGHFNADKNKLFFFWSQEFSGITQDYGSVFANTPTELERAGDFSQSVDSAGRLIPVYDPSTGQVFAGNKVPESRISAAGLRMLNIFPKPNYTDSNPTYRPLYNLRSSYSGNHPRRNDVLRLDAALTPRLNVYYRYMHDRDDNVIPWGNWQIQTNFSLSPVEFSMPGTNQVGHATLTLSPTLVNETKFGYSYHQLVGNYQDSAAVDRSRVGDVPRWNSHTGWPSYLPDMSFSGPTANPVWLYLGPSPWAYRDKLFALTDDLTKVWGKHTIKAGLATDSRWIRQMNLTVSWRGSYSFGRDRNNPLDTNHAFANALLGNFSSYTELNKRALGRLRETLVEWYVQDNWRVTPRLTLDLGVRFYHYPPAYDRSHNAAAFNPELYVSSAAPALYRPALDGTGKRVAQDPVSGTLSPAVLIGMFVPGSGKPDNGSRIGGVDGYPSGLYTLPWLSLGPRFGFAYDLTGDGKTALRGGFGVFMDKVTGNAREGDVGNPPVSYVATLNYSDLNTITQGGGGVLGPSTITQTPIGSVHLPSVMNFSLGLQRQMGGTVLDVSYVGSRSRHLVAKKEYNPIPLYSRFDAANQDPTRPGVALPDNFFRRYVGYGSISVNEQTASASYNSLQVSAERRFSKGFHFGIAYTWSKALGMGGTDFEFISPYFDPRQRNYGPITQDRTHVFVANYFYELPKLGARTAFKPLGWALDNWVVGGWTTFSSGAPTTPGFATTDGLDMTGSSEGQRIDVIGNPYLPRSQRTFFQSFNTAAFARPARLSFGNAGYNILRYPGDNNWDLSVTKRFPIFADQRFVQFRGSFLNAWNHTRFSTFDANARFDSAGKQTNPLFGAYNAARSPRTIELSLKLLF